MRWRPIQNWPSRRRDSRWKPRCGESDLNTLLNNVIREQPEAVAKIEAAVQALLKDVPPSRELLQSDANGGHILESTGHFRGGAVDVMTRFPRRFATSATRRSPRA